MAILIDKNTKQGLDGAFKRMCRVFGLSEGNEISNISDILNNDKVMPARLDMPVNDAFSTAAVGGLLVPATYWYRVTAVNAAGEESIASVETSQVVGAGTNTNTVTVAWLATGGAVTYNVYGRTTGAETKITASVGTTGLSYVDVGPAASGLSGALPTGTTINAMAGTGTVLLGGTVCVILNSNVAAGDMILVTPLDLDATLVTFKAVATAGTITVTGGAGAGANWKFHWSVVKKSV